MVDRMNLHTTRGLRHTYLGKGTEYTTIFLVDRKCWFVFEFFEGCLLYPLMVIIPVESSNTTSFFSVRSRAQSVNALKRKATQQNQSQILYNEEQHHHSIKDRFRKLEHSNMNLEKENLDLGWRHLY
jgi:hypothetical protein